jgi:hypothetical protein
MNITCPQCSHKFELDQILVLQVEEQLRNTIKDQEAARFAAQRNKDREDMQRYKAEILQQAALDKIAIGDQLKQEAERKAQFEREQLRSQLQFLTEQNEENVKKLQAANQHQVQALKLQAQVEDLKHGAELELQKALMTQKQELSQQLKASLQSELSEQYTLKIKELEHTLESQKKIVEDQNRKLNQGSMELQGEVQEDYLKTILQRLFPFDEVKDIAKGRSGADLIHIVRNARGEECGSIVYESKNTKQFANEWIGKLLEDRQRVSADFCVLVTQTLPSHIRTIGQEKDVWICGVPQFEGVAAMLRAAIIRVAESKHVQENKGDKMVMLYDYLTSKDFTQKWDAIREGFLRMKTSIDKQRTFYNKTLAEQEQIANGILINANSFLGDVQGISGAGMADIQMLGTGNEKD